MTIRRRRKTDAPNQDDDEPLVLLTPRAAESNKGDFGKALIIGGSRGMTGAVSLAGMAALRSGAGLVRLAVPQSCLPIVATFAPEYMTLGMPEDADGRFAKAASELLDRAVAAATAVACGPGLSQSDELDDLVAHLYSSIALPMVLDADGLNALSRRPLAAGAPAGPRVLTPHPGEFRRLAHLEEPLEREALEAEAVKLAAHLHAVIVLKGHRTLITDGERSAHNTTGNPGMATGGTGDVLTGVITALLAQKMPPFDAARLGVYLHGLAGDLAAKEFGEVSLIASDLIRHLPAAFRKAGM